MHLRDIMSPEVLTIAPDQPVAAARREMHRHRIRHLAVAEDGDLVGVVSEHDLTGGAKPRNRTVRDIMTAPPVSAAPGATLRQAANRMRGRTIGSLLVVEEGKLVGVVTTTDLLELLGRGEASATVRTEPSPVRRAPGAGFARGKKAARRATARRGRQPAQRSALPSSVPRPAKVTRGRSMETSPPAHIRVIGAELSQQDKDAITRKLGQKLGKFASSIERVSVRVFDANGPRGGVDQVCRIKVVLSALPSVLVEQRHAVQRMAISEAIRTATLAVRSRVRRRRLKPLRVRARTPLGQAS